MKKSISSETALQASVTEKRAFPRVACHLPVHLHAPEEDALLYTHALNLSANGAFIRVSRPLPLGTAVHLTFKPPGELDEVALEGTVIRHAQASDHNSPRGMGVTFLASGNAELAMVTRLVQRLTPH